MKATRLIRRSLAALLIGWLTTGAALAIDRLGAISPKSWRLNGDLKSPSC